MEGLKEMWGFVVGEFIPGSILSFDIIMLIDNYSSGALRSLNIDANITLLAFMIMSIIFGLSISVIVFLVSRFIEKILFDVLLKTNKITMRRNILDFNILTIKSMFYCLIIPTLLFGHSFPQFIGFPALNPAFVLICYFMAFIFFCLALIEEGLYREGTGHYI